MTRDHHILLFPYFAYMQGEDCLDITNKILLNFYTCVHIARVLSKKSFSYCFLSVDSKIEY